MSVNSTLPPSSWPHSLPKPPHPPPLSRPRHDIFSGAVFIDRPYGALNIFHTGGSVVGVGVPILVPSISVDSTLPIS